jgi:hypothetical protein
MKTLTNHNALQPQGGEYQVRRSERDWLHQHGRLVVRCERNRAGDTQFSPLEMISLPLHSLWSRRGCGEVCEPIQRERPDPVRFPNLCPIISLAYLPVSRHGLRLAAGTCDGRGRNGGVMQ